MNFDLLDLCWEWDRTALCSGLEREWTEKDNPQMLCQRTLSTISPIKYMQGEGRKICVRFATLNLRMETRSRTSNVGTCSTWTASENGCRSRETVQTAKSRSNPSKGGRIGQKGDILKTGKTKGILRKKMKAGTDLF